jgi:FHA domain-containing protein
LFGVKSRAKVGNRGGAPVSGMEKLLARFKAVFAPGPPAPPPQEVEITPTPPITAPEVAETHLPEPVAAVAELPLAEEPPAMAEIPRATAVEEAPTLVDEAPTMVDEAPSELEPVAADGVTLRLETERGSRSTFQVTKSGATIGRGPESTIQLADLSVSRKHARITYKQGAYWLSDLGSMGGTWIDGTKLAAPRRVATGQTIDIGLCRLVVVAAAEGEKTGAAKGPSNAA